MSHIERSSAAVTQAELQAVEYRFTALACVYGHRAALETMERENATGHPLKIWQQFQTSGRTKPVATGTAALAEAESAEQRKARRLFDGTTEEVPPLSNRH